MGRIYRAGYTGIAITAATDVLHLATAAGVPIIIHEVKISQVSLTATEMLLVKLHSGTGGTAGSALTEEPLDQGLSHAADTAVTRTRATQSTQADTYLEEYWNILVPFHYLPIPEDRVTIQISNQFIVEIETPPSASMNHAAQVVWEEIG